MIELPSPAQAARPERNTTLHRRTSGEREKKTIRGNDSCHPPHSLRGSEDSPDKGRQQNKVEAGTDLRKSG